MSFLTYLQVRPDPDKTNYDKDIALARLQKVANDKWSSLLVWNMNDNKKVCK